MTWSGILQCWEALVSGSVDLRLVRVAQVDRSRVVGDALLWHFLASAQGSALYGQCLLALEFLAQLRDLEYGWGWVNSEALVDLPPFEPLPQFWVEVPVWLQLFESLLVVRVQICGQFALHTFIAMLLCFVLLSLCLPNLFLWLAKGFSQIFYSLLVSNFYVELWQRLFIHDCAKVFRISLYILHQLRSVNIIYELAREVTVCTRLICLFRWASSLFYAAFQR